MTRLRQSYNQHFRIVLIITIAALTLLAFSNRFVQDDAYISFRYAKHLAEGHGLVYNIGEPPVEGYTNFLWTVLMAVPHLLHIDPVSFSYAAGLLCFAGTLTFTYHLALHILGDRNHSLLAIILLGTNYSFSAYATGGLETQSQALLFAALLYYLLDAQQHALWTTARLVLLSLLMAFALLTRLDSGLIVVLVVAVSGYTLLKGAGPASTRLRKFALLGLPGGIITGVWLLWKLAYYGNILPNTYYAKAGAVPMARGIHFIAVFFYSYLLFPLLIVALIALLRRRFTARLAVPGTLIALWMAYIIKVGGDFMEFRFMVAIMPAMFVIITWLLISFVQYKPLRLALVLMVLLGSGYHRLTFASAPQNFIETIQLLEGHLTSEKDDLLNIGRTLEDVFQQDQTISMATTAAGVIPYYAELHTIDMLGLNDAWVARNGEPISNLPGHEKRATFDYLLEQRTNLVIGLPFTLPRDSNPAFNYSASTIETLYLNVPPVEDLPPEARFIEIPTSETRQLAVLYLFPHPAVDAAIEQYGWRTYPILQ